MNLGENSYNSYEITCTITDNNSIGDAAGPKSDTFTLTFIVFDKNYAPEWSATSIQNIVVQLIDTYETAIPILTDPNIGDTHTLTCNPAAIGLSIDLANGITIDGT